MSEAERAGASRQDRSERLLAGRYRLGGVLGRGGMGTVWRAEDETLGRTVAVKELRFPGSIDEDEKRRLITRTLREAKAIARIRNNSAVTVFDVVEEDDRPWIVMELVEGKSLAEVIREDGLLEPQRAAEVGLAILDVLRSAHREGILHRDVKPSNVLMSEDGRVVLTDFGIAQVEGDPSITSTGMLVGAPSYISPERARGHKPGPAADLWSLGGLLYASVEGVPPYDKGSAIATLTAVMTEQLEEPKNAGPLRDVIYGLLTKDPAKRLDDAGARKMLNEVIHAPQHRPAEPEPVDATKVVPLPPVPGGSKRAGKGAESGSSAADSGPGSKRGEDAGERFRGAFRSVKKAAVAAGAGAGAAVRTKSADSAGTAGPSEGGGATGVGAGAGAAVSETAVSGSAAAAGSADEAAESGGARESGKPAGRAAQGAVVPGARDGQARDSAAQGGNAGTGGRSSGWPVVPPPDLPPRSVPRAPITDVVPKRTLVIIGVVVAVIVLGVVLALVLGGDKSTDSSADGAKSGGDKVTSTSSASAETKEDKDEGTRTDGGQSADATKSAEAGTGSGTEAGSGNSPSASASASGGSVGVSTYTSGQGFSIGLPAGWKYESTGAAGARFAGPDGQRLLVGWTTTPKSDPVADWKNQEQYMTRSQYVRIRIAKVDYRSWNTADWEFTYSEGGTKYRSVDRGFVVNGQLGYGLMYTAKASNWDSGLRKETWRTFTETFEPKS
ncbi:serine/threonine-protein kinase [Streptomyces sp. NBC_00459]|uniref:serine/threonine-protein kinase n=1 Tax=Streptomyces sp. NBC_00459 TaxID=2975749 RepID=UPI002E177678